MPTNDKPQIPSGYPVPPGGLSHPWNYEANLKYSPDWWDKGTYKLHILSPEIRDFEFVQTLYNFSPISGYEIDEIGLISDENDEQAFTAVIDLLEKKHGNPAHNSRWKPATPRKEIRTQLKRQRYRSEYAPHVKLLPLWQGASINAVKQLGESGFDDLTRTSDHLGKGYYGTDSANLAYNQAKQKYGEPKTLLVLSWYAGKVVYPVVNEDVQPDSYGRFKLKGQPHYANYDLHFAAMAQGSSSFHVANPGEPATHHDTVVFDSSQVLPRYLVSLKRRGQPSSNLMQELLGTPYRDPDSRSLLFQPNFADSTSFLHRKSLEEVQQQLGNLINMQPGRVSSTKNFAIDQLIINFLQDSTKEVLLLTTETRQDRIILGRYLERIYWNNYKDGQAIPLYISLPQIPDINGDLVKQALEYKGLSAMAISDLKAHCKFNLILAGYDELHKKVSLIKNNHFNRQGGIRGKIIVTCLTSAQNEDFLFYTEGGTQEQQANRLIRQQLPWLSIEECQRQLKVISNLDFAKAQSPSEKYSIARKEYQQNYSVCLQNGIKLLLPPVGGELKPWEYDDALRYSANWIDKGSYSLHELNPGNADYAFVAAMYEQSRMPGYELDQVYLVSDPTAEQAFTAHLALLERRKGNPEYIPRWQLEEAPWLRQYVMQQLEQKTYITALTHSVKLLPLWHGTGPAAASGIATSGFASLATVDAGYFGKGLYGSSSAEYSYRVYAKGFHQEDGLLLLSWYSAYNVYPVIKSDTHNGVERDKSKDKLFGKANYQNYDSHFIPVVPRDRQRHQEGSEDVYYPAGENETPVYQEFVTFPTAQVLPRYILSLRDSVTKQRLPGMAKFLATPKIESSHRKGLHNLSLPEAIAQLQHSAKEEREQDFMLTQGLSLYIPAQGTSSDKVDQVKPEDSYPLADKARGFLRNSNKEVWLLQGNSGSGKSLFGRHLEQKLWDSYQEGHLIPIFIPLPRINNPNYDLIDKALELKGIPPLAITELKTKKRFLFILDGYDEIPGKPKLIQLCKFNEPGSWQGKVIISSRTQHLSAHEDNLLYPRHPGEILANSASHFEKSFIMPFTVEQTNSYITEYCKSGFNKVRWDLINYQQRLKQFSEIQAFLKEPFLLFLVLNALPSLNRQTTKIKKIDLYQAFTSSWFKSQFARVIQHNFDLTKYRHPERDILNLFENYAKDLAFEMFLKDTQVIRKENDPTFNKFFSGEDANLAFQGCPLRRIGESYLFIHKSFQEYFTAKRILDELTNPTPSVKSLQQKLLVEVPAILNFIAERLRGNRNFQELLFNIILQSRDKTAPSATSAANAATLLNTAGVAFSGRDLRGVAIPGANLTGTILHATNLEGADLREVKFKGAMLQDANLRNSDMSGTCFGELAYKQHNEAIKSCVYSKDGKYFTVAAGSEITIYRVEKAGSLALVRSLTGHTNSVYSVTFSPDSKFLASGSGDHTVRLWSLTDPANNQTLIGHTSYVNSVAFSPDNRWLASGSGDKNGFYSKEPENNSIVRLWNLTDPNNIKCIKTLDHTDYVNSVAFSPDNQWLASGSRDSTVRLWSLTDPNNIKCIKTLTGHTCEVNSVAFSPDNQWLASGGFEGTVRLWSLIDPNNNQILTGHTDCVNSVAFSPDNRWLASGSGHFFFHVVEGGGSDNTVRLWSLIDPNNNQILTAHARCVNSVTFSSDNQWLASGSGDSTVRLWSLIDPNNNQTLIGHTSYVNSVAFSPDNRWLASGSGGPLGGGSSDNTVCLWSLTDLNNHQPTVTLDGYCGDKVISIAFSHDNQWLASGSIYLRIWNLTDPNKNQTLKNQTLTGHTTSILSVTFSPDSKFLASGGRDSTVCLWSLTDPNNIKCIKTLTGHPDSVNSVAFSPDNQWLASGSGDSFEDDSNDNTVRLWSLIDPNNNQILTGHARCVNSVTFSSDNQWLASGSNDKTIIVWSHETNIRRWREIFRFKTSFDVRSLAYRQINGHLYLATGGGSDHSVRLWQQLPDKLLLFCNSNQTTLHLNQANITNTTLSPQNAKLLLQRGATGTPKTTEFPDTAEALAIIETVAKLSRLQLAEPQSTPQPHHPKPAATTPAPKQTLPTPISMKETSQYAVALETSCFTGQSSSQHQPASLLQQRSSVPQSLLHMYGREQPCPAAPVASLCSSVHSNPVMKINIVNLETEQLVLNFNIQSSYSSEYYTKFDSIRYMLADAIAKQYNKPITAYDIRNVKCRSSGSYSEPGETYRDGIDNERHVKITPNAIITVRLTTEQINNLVAERPSSHCAAPSSSAVGSSLIPRQISPAHTTPFYVPPTFPAPSQPLLHMYGMAQAYPTAANPPAGIAPSSTCWLPGQPRL